MRGPGESYSEVILRLLKTEGACAPLAWLGLLLAHIAMMLAARQSDGRRARSERLT
jgi:hypothetical protein